MRFKAKVLTRQSTGTFGYLDTTDRLTPFAGVSLQTDTVGPP